MLTKTVAILTAASSLWIVACNSGKSGPRFKPPVSSQEKRIRDLIQNIDERPGDKLDELARIGRPAVPFLIEALADRTRPRNYAAAALGGIGPDAADAVPDLISLLQHEPHRSEAFLGLSGIGRPAVPLLIEALADRTRPRNYAARALGRIGPDAADSVPNLIHLLEYKPHRLDAIDGLGGIGPAARPAVSRLTQILHDRGASVSLRRSPSAADLKKYLDQRDLGWITVEALGNIGDRDAAPVLIEVLQNDSDEYLLIRAVGALGKLGDASVTPELALAYASQTQYVRLAVIEALAELRDLGTLSTLTAALDDDYYTVQDYALKGIVDLAEKVQEAELLRGLESALDGEPSHIRQQVVDAFEDSPSGPAVKRLLADPEAAELLEAKYHYELGSTSSLQPAFVELDAESNAYVFDNSVEMDAENKVWFMRPVLRKLDHTGVEQWSRNIPDLNKVEATTIDELGGVFLAGRHRDSGAFVAAKVDETGRLIWIAEAPEVASRYGKPKAISLTHDGHVLVVGSYNEEPDLDPRIAKVAFTRDGRLARVTIGDKADTGRRFGVAGRDVATTELMAVDDLGRVYALFSKSFAKPPDPKYVLVRFDAQGALEWEEPCEGFNHVYGGPSEIKVDAAGSTYLAGQNPRGDGRLMKVSANGQVEWSRDLDGEWITGMDFNGIGDVVVGWNRRPSKRAVQLAVLGSDGVVKSIDDVTFGTGHEGTGTLVDLAAGASGLISIVIQWEQVSFEKGRPYFSSSGSRLATYEVKPNKGIQPPAAGSSSGWGGASRKKHD